MAKTLKCPAMISLIWPMYRLLIFAFLIQYPVVSTIRLPFLVNKPRLWDIDDRVAYPHRRQNRLTFGFRGGASDDKLAKDLSGDEKTHSKADDSVLDKQEEKERNLKVLESVARKRQHVSDMILQLTKGIPETHKSMELRRLVLSRTKEYISDLLDAVEAGNDKLPHPSKLLHFLSPKVPAIKHSPDVNLRIHTAKSDIDSGIAASIIGALAHVCELYDKLASTRSSHNTEVHRSAAEDVRKDRRFEQLVECVISGVNLKKEKENVESVPLDGNIDGELSNGSMNIEELLDGDDKQIDEGLSVKDCCRAVWGMTMLGLPVEEKMSEIKLSDLFIALEERVRELLLVRLQLLQRDDLYDELSAGRERSTEDRLGEVSEELAEDAASSMWVFACLKVLTGMTRPQICEAACSILCQDPIDIRRRFQEVDDRDKISNIGESDVVDRLARAEATGGTNEEIRVIDRRLDDLEGNAASKDALLDWLSPNEVNDVLWSLSVHSIRSGSPPLESTDHTVTASVLGEMAFDRVADWLNADLTNVMRGKEQLKREVEMSKSVLSLEDDSMSIEVVDAAALLASEKDIESQLDQPALDEFEIKNIPLSNEYGVDGNSEVGDDHVVDEAKMPVSTGNGEARDNSVSEASINSSGEERGIDSVSIVAKDVPTTQGEEGWEKNDRNSTIPDFVPPPVFSTRDLTCLATSATELKDSLNARIVSVVIDLIFESGSSGVESLGGGDLADLAWAICKHLCDRESTQVGPSSERTSKGVQIVYWISRNAFDITSSGHSSILHHFQPHELGRLVWSIACILSAYRDVSRESENNDHFIKQVTTSVLLAASSNVSLFSTEDLVRIAWAFLEVVRSTEDALADGPTSHALGSLLSTIEESLYNWENGLCHNKSRNAGGVGVEDDSTLFSTFFGRSRLNLKVLNQAVGYNEEDEDEIVLAPLLEKSHLPLLRDLTVDPSTLCKAACGFARLSSKHQVSAGWSLTRVALRLLSSKNARLMKECALPDLIRLCEAAALSDGCGQNSELIIGFFVRKVIQVLNDSLSSENRLLSIYSATPPEIASLFWSLGKLGVRHSLGEEDRKTAYRRMRLVADRRVLSKTQIMSLSDKDIIKLLEGVVAMKFSDTDMHLLLDVILELENRSPLFQVQTNLVKLVEIISVVKEAMRFRAEKRRTVIEDDAAEREGHLVDVNTAKGLSEESKHIRTEKDRNNNELLPVIGNESVDKEILRSCDTILVTIASIAKDVISQLKIDEIRRLLTVYSLLPFQADEFVQSVEEEITRRKNALEFAWASGKIGDLLIDASERTSTVNATLFGEYSEGSPFEAIKSKLKTLFSTPTSEGGSEEYDEHDNTISEELSLMIKRAATSTTNAARAFSMVRETCQISPDELLQEMKGYTSFEIGRCIELVENYKRNEFSTGTRRSRYNSRRKEIAKRVLNRLIR